MHKRAYQQVHDVENRAPYWVTSLRGWRRVKVVILASVLRFLQAGGVVQAAGRKRPPEKRFG
eukprot:4594610-Pyramimonas_sp.AAC.1